jgi:hypothetical protein
VLIHFSDYDGFYVEVQVTQFLEMNPSLIVSGMSTRCEIESFEGEE